jgi:hypothetical protein
MVERLITDCIRNIDYITHTSSENTKINKYDLITICNSVPPVIKDGKDARLLCPNIQECNTQL